MSSYIENTKYATESLITSIVAEEKQLNNLKTQADELRKRHASLYAEFEHKDLHEDYDTMHAQSAYSRAAETGEKLNNVHSEITEIESIIADHSEAYGALCGALLQIAKQGISVVHNGLSACPSGRSLKGTALKDVVWAGRNQSLHYEEAPKQATSDVFQSLENDYGDEFSLSIYAGKNLGRAVINLLGWTDYENYKSDMTTLLSPSIS